MSRISPATVLVGIFAILFGLLGAYMVRQQMYQEPPEEPVAEAEPELQIVPLAAMDLPAGREIKFGDIVITQMTPEQLKKRGINTFMANTGQIIGRVLKTELKQGEVFNTPKFYAEGTGPSVADRLKPGYRAMTIPVEADDAVAGFAVAGSYVDVLFRSEADEEEEKPEGTFTLLDGVEVLALDRDTSENNKIDPVSGKRQDDEFSVTLAVRPEQATALRVVKGHGVMSLVLRHPEDAVQVAHLESTVLANRDMQTLNGLLSFPAKQKHEIEVYRGRQMDKVTFSKRGKVVNPDGNIVGQGNQTQPASIISN